MKVACIISSAAEARAHHHLRVKDAVWSERCLCQADWHLHSAAKQILNQTTCLYWIQKRNTYDSQGCKSSFDVLKYSFLTCEEMKTSGGRGEMNWWIGMDGWIDRQLLGLLAFDQISVHASVCTPSSLIPKLNPWQFYFISSEVHELWDQDFWMLHFKH